VNSFLIVRLGSLGDVVHGIPLAAAPRHEFPASRIDWMVDPRYVELLNLVAGLDRRIGVDPRAVKHGQARRRFRETLRELRQIGYDAAIDLQGLLKSAVLARLSGAAQVVGFASSYAREPLARVFYTVAHDPGRGGMFDRRETRHVVDINLGVLDAIGVTPGEPEFPIAAVESDAARRIAERTGGRYALLNPGAAWLNKRWPPDRFGAVAAALKSRHGLTSAILWGPGEEALAQETVAQSSGAATATDRTTIADIVALARGAAVMVSGDTGPTHIAAAVGTPLVGIYGPTRPARNGPLAADDQTVSRDAVCQCHHLRRCKLDRMCLLDIEVAEVLIAVERRLAAGRRRV